MNITNPSVDFIECLESQGNNIFLNTWFPTQTDLAVARQTQLYTVAHNNRSDQAQNSNPTWENTASMGIHHKGGIPTKTQ